MARKQKEKPKARSTRALLSAACACVAGVAAGLAVAALLRKDFSAPPTAPQAPEPPASLPVFTDVTEASGIDFTHCAGSTGRFYYIEVMGAGCAVFDADGDGLLDIYFVNGNRLPPEEPSEQITNKLYLNNGDGTFRDATAGSGVGDFSYGQGCCTGDYDGDGDQDLYVTNFGPNVLYRNRGDGTFEPVEGVAADPGWGQACAFFDADGDGDLDLYVQNYLEYSLQGADRWYVVIEGKRVPDYCGPRGYRGQQDRLYLNRGDGTFQDVTEERGLVRPRGTGMGLLCADLDEDGDMDIVVGNDSRPNFLFINDGKGYFTEEALKRGIAYNWEGGTEAFMGVSAGDYDGDGLVDIAIPCLRTEGFSLFHNRGGFFVDVSIPTGVDRTTSKVTGFAPIFLDYDSDGDLDLFFTTGEVGMGRTTPAVGGSFLERYAMPDLLLENREGRFVDISSFGGQVFRHRAISRACAAGDLDNDGDCDLVVTAMNGRARILRNDTPRGNWIGFALRGKAPNTDAVGAKVVLQAGGRTQVAQITSGGSYCAQCDRRVRIGLGSVGRVDAVTVLWPDGRKDVFRGCAVNRYHTLVYGAQYSGL